MPKINKPNLEKLEESNKCQLDGIKILPFLTRSFKDYVCNIKSGILDSKSLQSTVVVIFNNQSLLNPEIHLPDNFDDELSKCKEQFIIVSVAIVFSSQSTMNITGHSNIFLINKKTQEIEHFEPHGELFKKNNSKSKKKQIFMENTSKNIKTLIKSLAESLIPSYKFIPCLDYCPSFGPQTNNFEDQYKLKHCGPESGLCVVWSILYAYLRILNPTISRSNIISYMLDTKNNINITYVLKFITFIDKTIPDIEIEYNKGNKFNS